MWIRGPWWDGFWVFSGVPIGLGLLVLLRFGPAMPLALLATGLLSIGHALAPIALAWGHTGFRIVMRPHPVRYIIIPALILLGATALGAATSEGADFSLGPSLLGVKIDNVRALEDPFVIIGVVYVLWNALHFGMQNFGVMSIYRHNAGIRDPRQRRVDMVFFCLVTWATMLIPFIPHLAKGSHDAIGWPTTPHPFLDYVHSLYVAVALVATAAMVICELRVGFCVPRLLFIAVNGFGMIAAFWFGLWGFAIVAINHWLVAIGLSSHVYSNNRNWPTSLVAASLIIFGILIFGLLFCKFYPVSMLVTTTALGFRVGLGFVHFLYDRCLYKFSDPVVRATIGKDMGF
jgi:hypothetical protein